MLILPWSGAFRYLAITLLFLLVYAMVLRPVKNQALAAFRQIPQHWPRPRPLPRPRKREKLADLELPAEPPTKASGRWRLKKEIGEKIKTEPAAASRLVKSWIRDQPKRAPVKLDMPRVKIGTN